jgi:hypothetical protein
MAIGLALACAISLLPIVYARKAGLDAHRAGRRRDARYREVAAPVKHGAGALA